MARPPKSPAGEDSGHSDISGVRRDEKPLNTPENADPSHGHRLKREEDENRARPKPTRS